VTVEVSANDGADFTSDGRMYVYAMGATVERLVPSWGLSGTVGQAVTVAGRHFEQSPELSCRFGLEGRTTALYMSSTVVVCTAPGHGTGSVTVTVSNGAEEQDGMRAAGVRFEYKTQVDAWMAAPSLGATSGGTRVMLTGAALDVGGGGIKCIFGSARVAAAAGDGKALVCTAPPSVVDGVVEMWLADASSGTMIGRSAQFEYHVAPRVGGVWPSRGALTGGTAVSVTGSGFRDDAGLRCRFGETGVVSVGAGARWVSSTVVMCVAPGAAVEGGAVQVALEVSANGGADFTRDGVEFLYEAGATVEGLMPSWGMSGRAGQVVTVSGRHFAQSSELSCRFGLDGSLRGAAGSGWTAACGGSM